MSGNDDVVESLVARLRALGLGAGVPDDSVDRPQLTPTVRVSLDKADGAVQGDDARLTDSRTPTAHSHPVADVTGLQSALDGKASTSHTHTEAQVTGLTAKLATKADLVGGVVPTSQIPAISLVKPSRVANRAAMLALTAQEGDVAVVTATADKGTYMLGSGVSTDFASWVLLTAPDDLVSSVNGQTGVVVLAKGDVGLGNVTNTSDAAKPISTATQAALDNKVTKEEVAFQLSRLNTEASTSQPVSNAGTAYTGTVFDDQSQVAGFTVADLGIGQVVIPYTGWYCFTNALKISSTAVTMGALIFVRRGGVGGALEYVALSPLVSSTFQFVTTTKKFNAGDVIQAGYVLTTARSALGGPQASDTYFTGVLLQRTA